MFSCYMFYIMHCLGYFEEKEIIAILLSGASSNIKLGEVPPVLFIFHYFRETLRGQVGGGGCPWCQDPPKARGSWYCVSCQVKELV